AALRWLAHKGYIECGVESTRPGATARSFRRLPNLCFSGQACFVLTASGVAMARLVNAFKTDCLVQPPPNASDAASGAAPSALPAWDTARRELRYGGVLVKSFTQPARNQE